MLTELSRVLDSVVKDKGIDKAIIVDAIEAAMLSAAKKKFGINRDIEAHYNDEEGEVELFEFKQVVGTVTDDQTEITQEEARELDPDCEIGDSLGVKLNTVGLGRIAAQAAKQVIIQRVRDAERDIIYEEFKDRIGSIVHGIVRRYEKKDMIVDLGRTEAILPNKEQIPRENFRPGDRVRALILEIQREARGPQVLLTRASPQFLAKLFEMEVPEIYEGIVTVEAVAREPGSRAKIAVRSHDKDVDPVGACVGMKGARVQSVVQELRGEKIDIVPWTENIASNAVAALSPAEVIKVIVDEKSHSMEFIVLDDQLSLAIGRKGQNVRLAVELLGWNIDIKSESEVEVIIKQGREKLALIDGLGDMTIEVLIADGYRNLEDIIDAEVDELSSIHGISAKSAEKFITQAKELLEASSQIDEEPEEEESN